MEKEQFSYLKPKLFTTFITKDVDVRWLILCKLKQMLVKFNLTNLKDFCHKMLSMPSRQFCV